MDTSEAPAVPDPLPLAATYAVIDGREVRAERVQGRSDVLQVGDELVSTADVERFFWREVFGDVAGAEVLLRGPEEENRPGFIYVWYTGGVVEVGRALGLTQEQYNVWMGMIEIAALDRVRTVEKDLQHKRFVRPAVGEQSRGESVGDPQVEA